MQETINFLGVIDPKGRRKSLSNAASVRNAQSNQVRRGKFPFAKVFSFNQDKFNDFPLWLTEREDFVDFMYSKYEKRLLQIPKICEKEKRASDQRYFISLYLEQIEIFRGLPTIIIDIILDKIGVKYYKTNEIIHNSSDQMPYMGVIFVGAVEYTQNGKKIIKEKNDIIMSQAFYGVKHPTVIAKAQTVVLTLSRSIYKTIQLKILQDIMEKSRDQIADLLKSDFFIELHLKDKKAKSFFDSLLPQFYFKGEQICEAGQEALNFYIVFRGQVTERNHIYIRQHNKWPLPNRRWEVRAVYNSFQNCQILKQFSFFGDQQIINGSCLKSTYISKTHSILFSMNRTNFERLLNNEDFKRLKKYRNEHVNINYYEFQKSMRDRIKSEHDRKKIIHKAIDASFAHRKSFDTKRVDLVSKFEKQMLTTSLLDENTPDEL